MATFLVILGSENVMTYSKEIERNAKYRHKFATCANKSRQRCYHTAKASAARSASAALALSPPEGLQNAASAARVQLYCASMCWTGCLARQVPHIVALPERTVCSGPQE